MYQIYLFSNKYRTHSNQHDALLMLNDKGNKEVRKDPQMTNKLDRPGAGDVR